MKKIGILSLYYKSKNFGGLLQAYALQSFVEHEIGTCEQIAYSNSRNPFIHRIQNAFKYGNIFHNIDTLFKQMIVLRLQDIVMDKKIQGLIKERVQKFEQFENEIPHSKNVYNLENIEDSNELYHTYIVGSDQVWNAGIDLDTYLLSFVQSGAKKIAYAASSTGNDFVGLQKESIEKYLSGFNGVSVREKSLMQQLNGIVDKEIVNVVDPVFLIDRKEWAEILVEPEVEEKYVLCYMLGLNKKQRVCATKICEELGYKMLVFPHITRNRFQKEDVNFGDIRDYTSGPKEFLGLIKNAEAIITDSFHAVAFSIIFEKKFCVLHRVEGKNVSKSNNRIADLLDMIDENKRIVKSVVEAKKVLSIKADYNKEKLYQIKNASINWLKTLF